MSDNLRMDVQTLIDCAGGVGKLAKRLGVAHPTVCDWKRVGCIPASRMVQVANAFDISLDELRPIVRSPDVSAPQDAAA